MKRPVDNRLDFLYPVSLIPGIGARRVAALAVSGINTLGDVLYYFPLRYLDRSVITPIASLCADEKRVYTIVGTITKTRVERGRRSRLRAQVSDETGNIELLWFNGVPFLRKMLHSGIRIACTGAITASFTSARLEMVHPLTESLGTKKTGPQFPFLPHYSMTSAMQDAGLQQKMLIKAICWVLDNLKHYPQVLPHVLEQKYAFPSLDRCLRQMHTPDNPAHLEQYVCRIIYEELYCLAVSLRWNKRQFARPGRSLQAGALFEKFTHLLPYTLTNAQSEAIAVLFEEARQPRRMHRLLQGDVGSGKTVVAFCACLPALNEGMQVVWLAPTEILARQTYAVLASWCAALGLSPELLTGSVQSGDKKNIIKSCAEGSLNVIVGTHSLLQSSITFKRIGMIVIDEQHKFGAEQRRALQEKDPLADVLMLSATPIPQSLAQTLYGDLDIVSIRGVPAGRKKVSTHFVPANKREGMEKFIHEQITTRHTQVFYVVPRIGNAEEDDADGVTCAEHVYKELQSGAFARLTCALVHGRTPGEEQERIMQQFASGSIDVLVSTTIIEVGIDVPNAAIMIIENAERFGLSQLHQLRGRVGRGTAESYCFLLADVAGNEVGQERLSYFCSHDNGFDIAEQDLILRGPGEVNGWRQTGRDGLKTADIVRDATIFKEIMTELENIEKSFRYT